MDLHGAVPAAGTPAPVAEIEGSIGGPGYTVTTIAWIIVWAKVTRPEFEIDGVDSRSICDPADVGKNRRIRRRAGVIGIRVVIELTRPGGGDPNLEGIGREGAHGHIQPLRRTTRRHHLKIIRDAAE